MSRCPHCKVIFDPHGGRDPWSVEELARRNMHVVDCGQSRIQEINKASNDFFVYSTNKLLEHNKKHGLTGKVGFMYEHKEE